MASRVASSTSRAVLTLALGLPLLALALAPAVLAVGSPQGDSAAAWPGTWNAYRFTDGSAVIDAENEAGISPPSVDISSNGETNASVFLASDGTNVFFRMRLLGTPVDAAKGGFDSTFWLVQIATASDDTVRAVVGLNGKPVSTDYVYVTNAAGTATTVIYETPFDASGGQDSRGARGLSDGSGQYFADFQIPLARITSASGGAITGSTPVKVFFGSSRAANLATINKDYMTGSGVSFAGLESVALNTGAPTPTPTPT
ncbi:MAG: hypothetical protein OEW24_09425, partial [Chloroflexota bacterium]|nr:hypothetical protein [Chloroflexota bacterium]